MALKKCKECGEEVSSKSKLCPKCGKDQRNFFMKHKFITFILVIVVIVIISSLGSDNDVNVDTNKNNNSQVQQVAKIGDVVTTKDYEITVTSVKTLNRVGVEYFYANPSEGGIFVVVDWKYKNISEAPKGMFDFPSISLVDEKGTSYSSDIDASSSYATQVDPDRKIFSDLNPGITVKDSEVFEISKEAYETGKWSLKITADKTFTVNVK